MPISNLTEEQLQQLDNDSVVTYDGLIEDETTAILELCSKGEL